MTTYSDTTQKAISENLWGEGEEKRDACIDALWDVAQHLFSACHDLNALADYAGLPNLAQQRDNLPYGQAHNAAMGVLTAVLGDDEELARVVFDIALESGMDIRWAYARWQEEQVDDTTA